MPMTTADELRRLNGQKPYAQLEAEIERLRALVEEQNSTLAIMRGTRASVIEECAKVAESFRDDWGGQDWETIAAAIRALEEK